MLREARSERDGGASENRHDRFPPFALFWALRGNADGFYCSITNLPRFIYPMELPKQKRKLSFALPHFFVSSSRCVKDKVSVLKENPFPGSACEESFQLCFDKSRELFSPPSLAESINSFQLFADTNTHTQHTYDSPLDIVDEIQHEKLN